MNAERPDWPTMRTALAEASARLPELLRAVPDPTRPALGDWRIAEVVAHLSHAWLAIPPLAAGDLAGVSAALPPPRGVAFGTASGSVIANPEELAALTQGLVDSDPERDLAVLGDRIAAAAKAFCEDFDAGDGRPRPWLVEGLAATPSMFAGHLLNETLVHGYDLARASGVRWPVENRHAALVVRGFLFPLLEAIAAARGGNGPSWTLRLHLAGEQPLDLRYTQAGLAVCRAQGRVDAHLWSHPAALLLLIWNRRSLRSIMMDRQMMLWGRRPWIARRLLALAPRV